MAYGGRLFAVAHEVFCRPSVLSIYCCDDSLGFLLLFCPQEKINLPVPLMTYSDSAPPILKSIKYHLFDGKPQYPSIFEVRWRHPKFWALPLARGGNFWDPDCYSCLLALRRAPIHSSLENRGVKSWVTEVHGTPAFRPRVYPQRVGGQIKVFASPPRNSSP